ncbi:hypothetical protein A2791_03530 [Candidatus Saccharibacteria bacterium RIFCSPHIGHO2_01_FULL_46_30]|nr:MAG: hypothetical protein A2791_03530 [Candidatus Saccharibacteria bacterium RIFCSPHIGHO2_01_FULL_46_30]
MAQDDDPTNRSYDRADDLYADKLSNVSETLNRLEKKPSEADKKDESVKKQEQKPEDSHATANQVSKPHQKKASTARRRRFGTFRHKGPLGFVFGMIGLSIAFFYLFAPNIIMVNIKEMFTDDLADATIALYTYNKKMLDNKIGKAQCDEKDSIKCKLSTMSRNQKTTFEKNGFTVEGEKVEEDNRDDQDRTNDKPESRWKVSSIKFPNGDSVSSGADFDKKANESVAMRELTNSVFNGKSSFYADERFKNRLKKKFDLSKSPTVTGNSEEKVNESFDKSLKGSKEKFDEAGRAGIGLYALQEGSVKSQLAQIAQQIGRKANSYTQIQCAHYTVGKIASNAAKTAKEHTIARFAMQYLKAADQIKAGMADEVPANVLSGKLAYGQQGGYVGANATDATMYRHILFNEPVKDLSVNLDVFDSISALEKPWDAIIKNADATKGITGSPGNLRQPPNDIASNPRAYCLDGQTSSNKSAMKPGSCPALTNAAGTANEFAGARGALGGIAAASDNICPFPPKGIWLMLPPVRMTDPVVTPIAASIFADAITKWAGDAAKKFSSDTKGTAASDVLFAGTGAVLGDMAMSRGMRPADKQSLKQYLASGDEVFNEIDQVARDNGQKNPLDIYNKYSFTGSAVRSLGVTYNGGAPLLSSISNVLAIIPSSITTLGQKASAYYRLQPLSLDESRLKCADAEYRSIGIDADIACNVRYSMSKTELDAKVDSVLEYMSKAHPDESSDGLSDLQSRLGRTDGEGDAAEVSRMVSEAQQGSNAPFIDKKTGKPSKFSEYEKFLDYCVNREDPWGRSAMVVRREELSEKEKEEIRGKTDVNGYPLDGNENAKSENDKKYVDSYMSITEGSAQDQDWYTGKKCLEESEMMNNFRAYTMMCSVDGSYANIEDCTMTDREREAQDSFYQNNDILYISSQRTFIEPK